MDRFDDANGCSVSSDLDAFTQFHPSDYFCSSLIQFSNPDFAHDPIVLHMRQTIALAGTRRGSNTVP